MLKKSIALIALGAFAVSSLTACGTTDSSVLLDTSSLTQNQNQVEINSRAGIKKEIETATKLAFKELDKNGNKFITPDEYGLTTSEQVQAFNKLDSNKDGKISNDEFTPGFFSKIGLTTRLKSAADGLFKQLDKNKDNFVSKEEIGNNLVSAAFAEAFDKYDKQKKSLFHNDKKGSLSKSEFEDLFAHVALSTQTAAPTPAPAPSTAPAPVDPAPSAAPADPAAPSAAPATR